MSKSKQQAQAPVVTKAHVDHRAITLRNKQARMERDLKAQLEAAKAASVREALRLERLRQDEARQEQESHARWQALNTTNEKWKDWLIVEIFHAPKYGFAPCPTDKAWWSMARDVKVAKEAAARLRMKRDMAKAQANNLFANRPHVVSRLQTHQG